MKVCLDACEWNSAGSLGETQGTDHAEHSLRVRKRLLSFRRSPARTRPMAVRYLGHSLP